MNQTRLDLYTDYLTVTFGYATATGLSQLLDGAISHDAITRFLSEREYTSKDLWKQVKKTVREVESAQGVLIFDDTVQEKPHMDENDLICWHYDHCKGRHIKGINLLNCLYHSNGASIPVAFELIHKPLRFCDIKTRQEKRCSEVSKNERLRAMLDVCIENQLKFSYVLCDIWFACAENMSHIKEKKQKDFIMALKGNRLVALNEADRKKKRYTRLDQLAWTEHEAITGYLKGVSFPVKLARQVFTNKDGSTGILYLVCSQLSADGDEITTTYKKRWNVEVFHKSLKSNAAFAKSPAHTPKTQGNHVFASIVAVFKMECLTLRKHLNHFALRAKLYAKAIRGAFDELAVLRAA
jgi:hypothetical protein